MPYMRIEVNRLPFGHVSQIDEDGYMTLKEGARVKDVYRKLRLPVLFRKYLICTVNYKSVPIDTKLNDGDIVTFIMPVFGG